MNSDFDNSMNANIDRLANAWLVKKTSAIGVSISGDSESSVASTVNRDTTTVPGGPLVAPTGASPTVGSKRELSLKKDRRMAIKGLRKLRMPQVSFLRKLFVQWQRLFIAEVRSQDIPAYIIFSWLVLAVVTAFYPNIAQPPFSIDRIQSTIICLCLSVFLAQITLLCLIPYTIMQREVFVKERSNGFYGTTVFYLCCVFNLFLLGFIVSTGAATISYFGLGLQQPFYKFFLVVLLSVLGGMGFTFSKFVIQRSLLISLSLPPSLTDCFSSQSMEPFLTASYKLSLLALHKRQ